MRVRSKGKGIYQGREGGKRPTPKGSGESNFVGPTPFPTLMGAEMLPALLLHYCKIIKHAVAADEAEAQRGAEAAHSYQLPHNSHLVTQQRWAEEPIPHSTTQIQAPGEAAAVKAVLDLWCRPGLSSSNLVKLRSEFSKKVRKIESENHQPSVWALRDFPGAVTAMS